MTLDQAMLRPWPLLPNRVERFYRGGLLLERFRGEDSPADSTSPEDWVGSATRVWAPPGAPEPEAGLGHAEIGGVRRRIADLLAADPEAVAGADLVARAGPTLGLLVKLLDAAVRLPVHCHPGRAFARRHLGSFFGKAEAWLIVDTRDGVDPDGPGVWIGLRRDVARDELLRIIETQDTDRLLDAMHRRPTRPGDVWFVPPGVLHAIGAGVFMIEVQEPTDLSIIPETRDVPVEPADAHQHLGWEIAIEGIDRRGHDSAWIDGLRHDGRRPATTGSGWERRPLTAEPADPYFRAEQLTVHGSARPAFEPPAFLIGVVTAGDGRVVAGGVALRVSRGDTFGVPAAALRDLEVDAPAGLELIACLPPRPDDLSTEEP